MKFSSGPALTWADLNKKQQAYLTIFAQDFPAWRHTWLLKDKLNPVEYAFMKDHNLIAVDGPFICCTPTGLAVYNTRTIQLESD